VATESHHIAIVPTRFGSIAPSRGTEEGRTTMKAKTAKKPVKKATKKPAAKKKR
jgi:hypothetical protein